MYTAESASDHTAVIATGRASGLVAVVVVDDEVVVVGEVVVVDEDVEDDAVDEVVLGLVVETGAVEALVLGVVEELEVGVGLVVEVDALVVTVVGCEVVWRVVVASELEVAVSIELEVVSSAAVRVVCDPVVEMAPVSVTAAASGEVVRTAPVVPSSAAVWVSGLLKANAAIATPTTAVAEKTLTKICSVCTPQALLHMPPTSKQYRSRPELLISRLGQND